MPFETKLADRSYLRKTPRAREMQHTTTAPRAILDCLPDELEWLAMVHNCSPEIAQ